MEPRPLMRFVDIIAPNLNVYENIKTKFCIYYTRTRGIFVLAKIESLALGIKSVLIKFPEQELFSVTVYVIKKKSTEEK